MNFRSSKVYPRTLCEILDEDFQKSSGLTIQEIKKKYEGWILYLITKGNLEVIKYLVNDLSKISGLNREEIVRLIRNLKSQITIDLDLSVDFNEQFEPFIMISDKLRPKIEYIEESQGAIKDIGCENHNFLGDQQIYHNNSPCAYKNQLIPIENYSKKVEKSEETIKNFNLIAKLNPNKIKETPSKILTSLQKNKNSPILTTQAMLISKFEANHIIEEFFLSFPSPFVAPYLKLTKSPPMPSCLCNSSCSNHTFCSCSQFILSQIGTQKPLLVIKNSKRLPRRWNIDFFIFECQKSCKCNKEFCILTFFVPGCCYLPNVEFIKGESRACKRVLRGEFVMEVSGELSSSPFEKGIQLSQGIYKDLRESNVKNINEDKVGNVIPVRIFNYENKRIICRLALFATKIIEQGDIVCLNYNQLEKFMEY